MWLIRGLTCLIVFGILCIGILTNWIRSQACCIWDGKLTRAQNSLMIQFLMMITVLSSHLTLSHQQLYHHKRTQSSVIPLYLSMPWSWVNTKYSNNPRPTISCSQPVSFQSLHDEWTPQYSLNMWHTSLPINHLQLALPEHKGKVSSHHIPMIAS